MTIERELKLHRYWSSNCQQCSLKDKCTPGIQRRAPGVIVVVASEFS
jgi:hypothetical protein